MAQSPAGASPLRDDTHAGRGVLVTGGGSGIGRAIALEFARTGADVVVAGRRQEPLAETVRLAEQLGACAHAVPADVRDPADVERLVEQSLARLDGVDVLINNAGGQFTAPAEDISANGWRAVHRLAVDGSWDVTRQVANRSMIPRRGGLVAFLGFSPRRGIPGMAHASTARAALENLAASLALEWSRYRIRTVCVAPGTVATEGLAENYSSAERERWAAAVPLGRFGRPEEIAALMAFLASDAGSYITGTTVVVDGGVDAWGAGHPPPAVEGVNP